MKTGFVRDATRTPLPESVRERKSWTKQRAGGAGKYPKKQPQVGMLRDVSCPTNEKSAPTAL
jgi:hypothetical protein